MLCRAMTTKPTDAGSKRTVRPYGSPQEHAAPQGALAPELVRSTTFAHDSADALRQVAAGEVEAEFYPRYGHPASRLFESRLAEFEGADGAVAFASGMAALHALFCAFAGNGDAVVISRQIYGGVEPLAELDLKRFGIDVRRVDPFDDAAVEAALGETVRLVHVESPSNPLCRVPDLRALARIVHASGALLSVDATFMPPPLQRTLELGADLAMHSATKILGGHSDALGGIVAGRHAQLEILEAFRRRTGAILSPDTAWLLARSLETLDLRARHACDNALQAARFLDGEREAGGRVRRVHYSGLENHPDHAIAAAQMEGFGYMLAFEVEGGLEGAVSVYDRLQVVARAPSLGGIESLASLPVHTSHAHMPAVARRAAGVADGLIRLSVGIEPYEELEADLAQALRDGPRRTVEE
jgi:cystathionine beta-lyase/cystathionine gamma-synthase